MAKKTGKRKLLKLVLLILAAFVLFAIIVDKLYAGKNKTATTDNTPKDSRLADPDLLFASLSSSGLCSNSKGEEGGCHTYIFLYNSGKYIDESGWEGLNNKKMVFPTVEKKFDQNSMNIIIKQIRESDIMKKDCPAQQNMDAWFYYKINLDGTKKVFDFSPPTDCHDILNKIEVLINSTAKSVN